MASERGTGPVADGALRPRRETASGAVAIGALAWGALAVGVVAIGAVAIARLTIRRARFGTVEIDRLIVRDLRLPRR